MKKLLAIILTLVLGAAMLAGCGSSGSSDSKDSSEEKVVFKHGFDKDFPPYSYINDEGETTGLDVELAQAACEKLGWEYEGVPINWDAKDAELQSGSIDCIWSGFTRSPDREEKYAWSEAYSINTIKIMVLDGSAIKTADDLKGKKVGVQGSTSAQEMMETPDAEGGCEDLAKTFASTEVYDTYTIAINDLKAGAIDAIAIDVTTGNYQMTKVDGLKYLDEDICDEIYAIGFRTDDTDMRDQINEALKEMAEDGTMEEIGKKYPEVYENLSMLKNE